MDSSGPPVVHALSPFDAIEKFVLDFMKERKIVYCCDGTLTWDEDPDAACDLEDRAAREALTRSRLLNLVVRECARNAVKAGAGTIRLIIQ